jgi:hypothetical protein
MSNGKKPIKVGMAVAASYCWLERRHVADELNCSVNFRTTSLPLMSVKDRR